jgi:hypothetical protein
LHGHRVAGLKRHAPVFRHVLRDGRLVDPNDRRRRVRVGDGYALSRTRARKYEGDENRDDRHENRPSLSTASGTHKASSPTNRISLWVAQKSTM